MAPALRRGEGNAGFFDDAQRDKLAWEGHRGGKGPEGRHGVQIKAGRNSELHP